MSGGRSPLTGLPRVGTAAHKRRIGERDNWTCGICGNQIDPALSVYESDQAATVDHIIPKSAGGTHEDANLQIAHLECNRIKGRTYNRPPETPTVPPSPSTKGPPSTKGRYWPTSLECRCHQCLRAMRNWQ